MERETKKFAQVRLAEETTRRQALEVGIPRGTTVKSALRVVGQLDAVIEKLTGCPCLSGIDIHFHEHVLEKNVTFHEQLEMIG